MLSVRAKIRSLTDRRFVGLPVEVIVARHLVLRGWAAYFRNGNSARKFAAIDGYVHERLAIWTSSKPGRQGRNWQSRYTAAWLALLGVYRLSGRVRYATADASR
jgi:Group II intron, maturase-specific domain